MLSTPVPSIFTNFAWEIISIPLAKQKSWLTCVTWLPVSNNAVTGCPLIKILSSLALPTSFSHTPIWARPFCSTKSSPVTTSLATDFTPMLASTCGCLFRECLFNPCGLLLHSPFETALCLLKKPILFLNAQPPQIASIGIVYLRLFLFALLVGVDLCFGK